MYRAVITAWKKKKEKNPQILKSTWGIAVFQITTNCGKFFKKWEYQTTWLASWEICMQVKKNS